MKMPTAGALIWSWICLLAGSSTVGAQEFVSTDPIPAEVRCVGLVVDEHQQPIADAEVFLVAPRSPFWYSRTIEAELKVLQTNSDYNGRFETGFSGNDPSFLARGEMALIVHARGRAMRVQAFEMERLLVDLPFQIQLDPVQPITLRLLDADGSPIAGAVISPAHVSGTELDFLPSANFSNTTDQSGEVHLDFVSTSSLREIYASSPVIGRQQLPVVFDGVTLTARAMAFGELRLEFSLPDIADSEKLLATQIQVVSRYSGDSLPGTPIPAGWQTAAIEQGVAMFDKIPFGALSMMTLGEFPFVTKDAYVELPVLTEQNSPLTVNIECLPARKVVLTFVDESGKPLPNLDLGTYRYGSPKLTDEQGQFEILVAEGKKPDGQLFPTDAFSRHIVVDPFGVMLERLQPNEAGHLEPISMARSHLIVGQVQDDLGWPSVGATVDYTYSRERFNWTGTTLTDSTGRFEIRGLPPGAAVEVSARKNHWMTRDEDRISQIARPADATTDHALTLVVYERTAAAPAGRLVDQRGQPLAGVNVRIDKAVVGQIESFGPEHLSGQPLLKDIDGATTDSNGVFRYPATAEFDQRLQLKVDDQRFLTFRTQFMDGSKRELADDNVDLGTFHLVPRPEKTETVAHIVDSQTGRPVPHARVASVGVHAGTTLATADERGVIEKLILANTSQVLGVKAEGYRVLLQHLENVQPRLTLELTPTRASDEPTRLAWFDRTAEEYRDLGEKLFAPLEQPPAKESTFHRQLLYFRALAECDIERFEQILSDPDCPYEYRTDYLSWAFGVILRKAPHKAAAFAASTAFEPHTKSLLLSHAAFGSLDPAYKDEWYGEALVASQECSEEERLRALGAVAIYLLLDDRALVAQEIIRQAWESATEWRAVLKEQKASVNVGLARRFGPALMLIEPELGRDFIRLLALQDEKEELVNEGLAMLSLADWERFESFCKSNDLEPAAGRFNSLLQYLALDKQPRPHLRAWAEAFARRLPNSQTRMQLLLVAAKYTEDRDLRDELMQLVVHGLETVETPIEYFWSDPARVVSEELLTFESLEAAQLDELIFACLARAPQNFEAPNTMGVLGNLARLLAMRDVGLARRLLEPAFDEVSWLHQYRSGSEFRNNFPLRAAVWVDPNWALALAEEISQSHERDEDARRLQTCAGVIEEIGLLLSALEAVGQ